MAAEPKPNQVARTHRVERCSWRSLGAAYRLHRDCFPYPYPIWRMIGYRWSPDSRVFIVRDRGQVVGYLIATITQHLRPPRRVGEIISLAVRREWRRQGVGTDLLLAALDFFSGRDLQEIYLQVAVGNEEAQAVYRRLGFAITERLPSYYIDGEDAYLMCLTGTTDEPRPVAPTP